jgi:hypothetical protein
MTYKQLKAAYFHNVMYAKLAERKLLVMADLRRWTMLKPCRKMRAGLRYYMEDNSNG